MFKPPSDKVLISKRKLYGLGLVAIVSIVVILVYQYDASLMNRLEIRALSVDSFVRLPTIYGWDVTMTVRNVGRNDVYEMEIKVELVCDGEYLITKAENIDRLVVDQERTMAISVSADKTTTNVMSASSRKIIVTITLGNFVFYRQAMWL